MAKKSDQGEVLGEEPTHRLETDVAAALRRKPAQEPRLSGALRALAPHSVHVRRLLGKALETLVRRGSFQRPLYASSVRALSEFGDRRVVAQLKKALNTETAGGLATLSAACFLNDASLAEPLVRVATSRHPHLAFAAEVARVVRGESNGEHIASVAPKIKESHRIALCSEVFVPLLRRSELPLAITPALAVLRDAERHLGRWLVLGEIAVRAGDTRALEESRSKAEDGPSSARAAWAMVAWALAGPDAPPPPVRPTVELVARLSDRPSADRDTAFLYRLAAAQVAVAKPMLETLAKGSTLGDEVAIRAAMYLAREYGRRELIELLRNTAGSAKREAIRGVAASALYDVGEKVAAVEIADELVKSRQLQTVTWGALIRAAKAGRSPEGIVSEATFRRVQMGWVE